jgi:hypothetical protein
MVLFFSQHPRRPMKTASMVSGRSVPLYEFQVHSRFIDTAFELENLI